MSSTLWPEPEAVLAYLRDRMALKGAILQIASYDDLTAGFERARTVQAYEHNPSIYHLAAIMFDVIATRHPLVDGNKRLAWLAAIILLDLNGRYLDASEDASFAIGMAVIAKERTVEDLAAFFEEFSIDSEY